jgi:hypothetical protein
LAAIPWNFLELTVIIFGVAIYYIWFPFFTAPISLGLFVLSENNISTIIFGQSVTVEQRC